MSEHSLTIAIPRGAMFKDSLDLLDRIGIDTEEVRSNDRKLYFPEAGIITMRPSDVITYVNSGAAAIGITGKDVIAEHQNDQVYELLDLGFAGCKMVLAAPDVIELDEVIDRFGRLRVATKYTRLASEYFRSRQIKTQIIEVKGSVELAPLTGLADAIVDLTATGATLRENELTVRDEIMSSTARLIANPVAYTVNAEEIDSIVSKLKESLSLPK